MEFDNSRPIWQQLVTEFGRLVVNGTWLPGARISSVRDLAVEFGVNPNTVQRALAEFERLGLAKAERTSGRFVTTNQDLIDKYQEHLAYATADAYIEAVQGFGMNVYQATKLVHQRWSYPEGGDNGSRH